MNFNLPQRKQKDMGIDMGPLMDIVFILLIFFCRYIFKFLFTCSLIELLMFF